MVDEFHHHGIRVFLDVITHGVMKDSPLIKRHPDWFEGNGTKGSWGMIDYAWDRAPPELEAWWIRIWSDMALKYGVDGFRLDTNAKRPDLWRKIKERCTANGKEIIIFNESLPVPGYSDVIRFAQGIRYFDVGKDVDEQKALRIARRITTPDLIPGGVKTNEAPHFLRSVELSCHDAGWEGFPLDRNPYVVRGRRWLFGYAGVLQPAIVIMMSGEEFDADFRPLPRLATSLFGAKDPGRGRWLYGSWLDWSQLAKPRHQAMFEDAKQLLAIRRRYRDLIHAVPYGRLPRMAVLSPKNVQGIAPSRFPPLYLLWNERHALLIAGNPSETDDVSFEVTVDLKTLQNGPKGERFEVSDLRHPDAPSRVVSIDALRSFRGKIGKDGVPGGGVAVYRIRPAKK